MKTCLYPDCPNSVRTRGLCSHHYQVAHLLIKAKETTWAKLEATGKARVKNYTCARTNTQTAWFLGLDGSANPVPYTGMPDACLFTGCTKTPISRGLCSTHYRLACQLVQRKRVTWDILAKTGRAASSTNPRCKTKRQRDWFLAKTAPPYGHTRDGQKIEVKPPHRLVPETDQLTDYCEITTDGINWVLHNCTGEGTVGSLVAAYPDILAVRSLAGLTSPWRV